MANALATIGKLETELANAAFTLRYGAYLGNAISLIGQADGVEWLGPRSEEFAFIANGRPHGILDVGYVEWIDDFGPLGAVLTQRRMGESFALRIEDVALRKSAALLRRVSLTNTSGETQCIERATPLAWTLRGRTECHTDAPGALCSRSAAERGLFFYGEGLRPEASPGELDTGRLLIPGTRTLAPGETWAWPLLWIAPFNGPVAEAWLRTRGHLQEVAARWAAHDSERSSLRNTPEESDS